MLKLLILLSLGALAVGALDSKIEPNLTKSIGSKDQVNVFVRFGRGHRSIINGVSSIQFNSRAEKISHLVGALKDLSKSSQRNALNILLRSSEFDERPSSTQQFWVSNELYVKGASSEMIKGLAALPEVSEIREERLITLDDATVTQGHITAKAEWNLELVEAPNAWQLPGGNDGQGVVVANVDSGVRHTHEALRRNYRADYGWFDPFDGVEEPVDYSGHGTHTMGTIVGAGVGVAPGAQWVACQGCFGSLCTDAALLACGQWTLCPTRANGTDEDCSKAPHVVSNSWGDPGYTDFYHDVVFAWRAAGIIPVFAMGNEGPRCSSFRSPGEHQAVIGVGSTTSEDMLSSFSSLGPASTGGTKPEISAPGSNVRSAMNDADNSYGEMSGTSMATPHVTGAVALLLSRNPNLTFDQVRSLLQNHADTSTLGDVGSVCGGQNSTTYPNNFYGHGRLNTRKSLQALINNF